MKKSISTDQTADNITKVIQILTDAPAKFESLSKGLSDKQLHQPLGSGERSFHEMLAHVINCEARASEAIYSAVLVDEPLFIRIHAERELGQLLRFDLLPFADLIAYFKLRRTVLLRTLKSLTEKQWARTIREEQKQRKESVYWQARGQAMHELEHLTDLEGKLKKLK